ncbi:60S ribosomal protein L28 [Xylariaceae sp. FL0804]|nr:60S ribosomal protein L28 [Xylariaceae sp. FL0804]
MSAASSPMVSSDLIWAITRNNNSYLVKSKQSGGVQFSRDPLNLTNLNARKWAGYANEKAVGVAPSEKGGVKVIRKNAAGTQKPGKSSTEVEHHGGKSTRNIYKSVANSASKNSYRPDLREAAVARVSAIRKSQKEPKPDRETKPRGAKAKEAAASS